MRGYDWQVFQPLVHHQHTAAAVWKVPMESPHRTSSSRQAHHDLCCLYWYPTKHCGRTSNILNPSEACKKDLHMQRKPSCSQIG